MSEARKRRTTRRSRQTGRKSRNTFTTKSGQTIRINRSLSDRIKARREDYLKRRAQRLAGMPKSRVKRFFYRLHPRRMKEYWFSREGGIMALKVFGIGIISSFLLMIGVFAYFRKDLPNLHDISGNNIGGSIRYYDRTGQTLLWEDYDAVKRIPVTDDNISDHIKNATVAIEDQDFFNHSGFDLRGIIRAGVNNTLGKSSKQGGSTITQQLVRLTQSTVGKEQTYQRKIKELILSIELERTYSKQEILTGYLNTAPYGNVQYGVEAATRDYFQKSAKDLTLDEAAFLAAIPQSPSYYSPYGPIYDPEAVVGRQHYILDLMEQQRMISSEERDEAKQVDTLAKVQPTRPKYEGITAPWFVLTAKEQLQQQFGEQLLQSGGWKVTTTLDMNLQRTAEEQVKKGMAQINRQGGNSAAFVAEEVETGQVVALVGGSDFNNETYGQNNYARYRLPPGSSIKPYNYIALIENTNNAGAGSVLYDTQGPLEGYPCTNRSAIPGRPGADCLWNFDRRYPGPMTLRYALGGSRNVPAVKAMLIAGIDKTIETANNLMGVGDNGYGCFVDEAFTQPKPCGSSAGIGDGAYLRLDEHVHGYASISRNGLELPMSYVLNITDAENKNIYEWTKPKGNQVIRPDSAYIVADMMADPRASYFGRKPHRFNGWEFSLKTGTTNDAKDAWLLGFSTKYSAGVWAGYHNRQVEMSGSMETMTLPIWEGWMQEVHRNLEPVKRERPAGVQTLPAFVVRNHVGFGSIEPSPSTDLFPGWYQKKAGSNQKRTIDKVSNKLATDCTPPLAREEVNEGTANQFSSDEFVNAGSNANTNDTDDVHKCDDVKPGIRLVAREAGDGAYTLEADVTQGTHPLSGDKFKGTVNFKVDGETIRSFNVSSPGVVSMNYTPDFAGTKRVTAEVIDSVLYNATDSTSVTGTGSGLTLTSARISGGRTRFSWSGGTGRVTIYADGNDLCGSGSSSCSVIDDRAPAGTRVYAEDSRGRRSNEVTVSN